MSHRLVLPMELPLLVNLPDTAFAIARGLRRPARRKPRALNIFFCFQALVDDHAQTGAMEMDVGLRPAIGTVAHNGGSHPHKPEQGRARAMAKIILHFYTDIAKSPL